MFTVYFDEEHLNSRGKRVYFWDFTQVSNAADKQLVWFHEHYGLMKLYRLHAVDAESFIAEDLNVYCRTSSDAWGKLSEDPALALAQ